LKKSLLKVKDLCELFGISSSTVRRWVKEGMPCVRVGTRILRFREPDVVEWVMSNKKADKKHHERMN